MTIVKKLYLRDVPIEINDLTRILCESLNEDELRKLIIDINESVCTLEFTVGLRDKFDAVVQSEIKAGAKIE